MKPSELRPCDGCGERLGVVFYRVRATPVVVDAAALKTYGGLADGVFQGKRGAGAIAEALSPDPEVAKEADHATVDGDPLRRLPGPLRPVLGRLGRKELVVRRPQEHALDLAFALRKAVRFEVLDWEAHVRELRELLEVAADALEASARSYVNLCGECRDGYEGEFLPIARLAHVAVRCAGCGEKVAGRDVRSVAREAVQPDDPELDGHGKGHDPTLVPELVAWVQNIVREADASGITLDPNQANGQLRAFADRIEASRRSS